MGLEASQTARLRLCRQARRYGRKGRKRREKTKNWRKRVKKRGNLAK